MFKSPDELATGISHSLYRFKERNPQNQTNPTPALPIPPALFAAPHYSSNKFIGRRHEKQFLSDWLNNPEEPVMVIRAIGGQGKSALMWDWMQSIKNDRFAGKIWWNFDKGNAYQQDGKHMQAFLRYAISYMRREAPQNLKSQPFPELVSQFITLLQQQSYLVVLDGLERLLIAYNRLDSSHIRDENIDESRELRACTSPQDVSLLQQLIHCKNSKILIGSRLFPTALDDITGNALPGVQILQLPGLDPQDAIALIEQSGVKYTDSDKLNDFLKQLGYHGLMLVLAAGHISRFRHGRGDFDAWFSVYGLQLFQQDLIKQRQQLLEFAIEGMSEEKVRFFEDISAFKGTITQKTIDLFNPYLPSSPPVPRLPLVPPTRPNPFSLPDQQDHFVSLDERKRIALQRVSLIQKQKINYESSSAWLQAQGRFDQLLQELEVRGLLEWDRESGNYDLHPVVRAFAHDRLGEERKKETSNKIRGHLELIITRKNVRQVRETSELDNEIEYYDALLRSGDTNAAVVFFTEAIYPLLATQLNDYQTIYKLLNPLIEHEDYRKHLKPEHLTTILHDYSLALEAIGKFERAANIASENFLNYIEGGKIASLATGIMIYARHMLALNRLADALNILEIAERVSILSESTRQLGWTREYQAEIYSLMGREERSQELIDSIEFNQQSPFYLSDFRLFLQTTASIRLNQNKSSKELVIQLGDLLQTEWQYGSERFYHQIVARQAWLDKEYAKAEDHFNEAIRMNNAVGRPVALDMAYLANVLQMTGSSPQALSEKTLEDAIKLPSSDRDKAQIYHLAAQFYLRTNQKTHALDMIRRAWHYAASDGSPYVHAGILSELRILADTLGETLPSIPDYEADQSQRIPYQNEIQALIKKLETGGKDRKKPLADTQFAWDQVTLFQVCAVCTFGQDTKSDERVWNMIREIHGLSDRMYDAVLYVYEDDSTEFVQLDRPFEQIRPNETQALDFSNDIKSNVGSITLITGNDDQGDYYAFVYCLAEEILRFAKDCESEKKINLNDYFVKLLYEGRGTCVSTQHLMRIQSDYKIRGDCLTIIIA